MTDERELQFRMRADQILDELKQTAAALAQRGPSTGDVLSICHVLAHFSWRHVGVNVELSSGPGVVDDGDVEPGEGLRTWT